MYYSQQNRLRWEYVTPYTYTFILNDAKVLIKNNHRNDVIDVNQNKMFKEIARIMMNSVLGKCLSDEKDFKVSIVESKQEWVATLLPQRKDMRQMFQKIILRFNRLQSMVSRVELVEKNGDRTLIELQHVQKNVRLDELLFAIE
jgi:outer membrane lipoprotein carrier protein